MTFCLCVNLESDIVRTQFAILNEAENYSFSFVPDFEDKDIFPGNLCGI